MTGEWGQRNDTPIPRPLIPLSPFLCHPPPDAAGREKRTAALRQARSLLHEFTAGAKYLSEDRDLRRLIDEELALLGRK